MAFKTRMYFNLRFNNVTRRVKRGKRNALYQVAGLVRTATKRSMRTRAGPSRPGSPPHAHTRGGLRVINFVVDEAANAALVGPIKFPGSNFFNEPVPHIQEFGGNFSHRRRFFYYPPRSYMNYTVEKLKRTGKIPKAFAVNIGRYF